jgi:hypothetical protein
MSFPGFPSFLYRIFGAPTEQGTISQYVVTEDQWVTINNTLFRTQWNDCSYPISGGYGQGPRYLYYALVFVSIIWRDQSWVVSVALGSAMIYSSTAAIHSMVFAALRTQLVPQYMLENYEVVIVGNDMNGQLQLPVLPIAWDSDIDAILAIVGVAFLVVAPMQAFSRTFKRAEGKAAFFLWSLLLLAGMICAFISEA